ncbi:MAG: saccharopine dehydrogenase C-terminal domain-containing protein, partial [Methanomassiliicoccales archaeon]
VKYGVTYVPDAGYAPGLTNVLAGKLFREGYERIGIYVGGLPLDGWETMLHAVTFNVEGLIDEYVRPARLVSEGSVGSVDPLEIIKRVKFKGAEFEAFYSDGLRTLLRTLKTKELFELTFRYSGHLELMKRLRDMGFFSLEKIGSTSPRKMTERLLSVVRCKRDMCLTCVEGRDRRVKRYVCVDKWDGRNGLSSMGRMTGFSAYAMARIVLDGGLETGVRPPEFFGMIEGHLERYLTLLRKKGIEVEEEYADTVLA